MHVFLLIFAISGKPEHIVAMCDTYLECSRKGAEMQKLYAEEMGDQPYKFSFRVIPGLVFKGVST